MDIEDQFSLEHLLFRERTCRRCLETKDLIDGFYLTRKGRGAIPSAYSYECKICTISRIKSNRKNKKNTVEWEYPDW
jgi:hypothetical protein